jgi:hypothetical protein
LFFYRIMTFAAAFLVVLQSTPLSKQQVALIPSLLLVYLTFIRPVVSLVLWPHFAYEADDIAP